MEIFYLSRDLLTQFCGAIQMRTHSGIGGIGVLGYRFLQLRQTVFEALRQRQ
jgi:hypothetical protein